MDRASPSEPPRSGRPQAGLMRSDYVQPARDFAGRRGRLTKSEPAE